jgi:hypothetical protein
VHLQDVDFRTAAAARWSELRAARTGVLRNQAVIDALSTLKAQIGSGAGSAAQRNFDKWSSALNSPVFGVVYADWAVMFDAETTLLTEWVLARIKWLFAAFAAQGLPSAVPKASTCQLGLWLLSQALGRAGLKWRAPMAGLQLPASRHFHKTYHSLNHHGAYY